jgi:hypothetical protein
MKTKALRLLLILLMCLCVRSIATGRELSDVLTSLIKKIPPRPHSAMTGSEFADRISVMDKSEREQAIEAQLASGNFPDFLRMLKPVRLSHRFEDGGTTTATIFAMPDYLAIGSDTDFLLIPMALHTGVEIAAKFGFILPTKKMVDAIFTQSDVHLTPEPMQAGPLMRSTAYYVKHNQTIREQRLIQGCPLNALISGHKKDVVLTNRLARNPEKCAIYGWHRPTGIPIQPLSTVHGKNYADYSHGVRLVSDTVLIGEEPRSIYDVLEDSRLARILSDEGVISEIRRMLAGSHPPPATHAMLGQ